MADSQPQFRLQTVAFFGRTLAEYLQMFALDLESLRRGRVLDVASGPGSFVAEALALGLDATGCDPMYVEAPERIAAQGKADIDACREQIRSHPGTLVYRDIDRFYADKYAALERFAADFHRRHNDGRYVAGGLPNLPFEDRGFDVVLSANFLMIYAPLADGGMHDGTDFGLEFHRAAFRELARVTRRELRVAGMHTWTQPPEPHPYCRPVTRVLEDAGFAVELLPIEYDDGCQESGGHANQVLVARRMSLGAAPPLSRAEASRAFGRCASQP
jgi:SAM-dependent methyltransferase